MKYFHCPVNDWNCPYYKDRANIEGKKRTAFAHWRTPMKNVTISMLRMEMIVTLKITPIIRMTKWNRAVLLSRPTSNVLGGILFYWQFHQFFQ